MSQILASPVKSADDIVFRCSGLHHIMSDRGNITATQLGRLKELQERNNGNGKSLSNNMKREMAELIAKRDTRDLPCGVKTHLIDLYTSIVEHRTEDVYSKYIEKGNHRENDAIRLVSLALKRILKKNEIRMTNKFITGECDIQFLSKIGKETVDTKCNYSRLTFNRIKYGGKKIDTSYEIQGHGYMALFGSVRHTIAYCTTNGLASHLDEEKRKLGYIFEYGSNSWIDAVKQVEINHIFDLGSFISENPKYDLINEASDWNFDIDWHQRIFMQSFDRDDNVIRNIYSRVQECRQWMNDNLFNKYNDIPDYPNN